MFSEKKKKSKGWLVIIPFLIIFIAGLWLNSFTGKNEADITDSEDTAVYSQQQGNQGNNDSNEIPIYEYDNNDGDAQEDNDLDQGNTGDDVSDKQEDTDETKVVGLADYFMVISENDEVKVKQFKDGILIEDTVTDIEMDALPQYDRDSLDRGIILLTQEEVDMLLENYAG